MSPPPAERDPPRTASTPIDQARQIAVIEHLASLSGGATPLLDTGAAARLYASTGWLSVHIAHRGRVHPVRVLFDVRRCSSLNRHGRLRAELTELLVLVPPAPPPESSLMESDLLDDHDDREVKEMNVATPLQPTVLLNHEDTWPG